MAIETLCSGCGKKLAVGDENAGKRARCPNCGQIYTVPHLHDSSTSQPPNEHFIASAHTPVDSNRVGENSGNASGAAAGPTEHNAPPEQFWMRAGDGSEYGPADRATLNRWFAEGRVGSDYQIKHGEGGIWQTAQIFRPSSAAQPVANPYGTNNPYAENPHATSYSNTNVPQFQKSDPSALVLSMGILAWVMMLACPGLSLVPGIIAWVTGRTALQDMQSGLADASNIGLVKVGYYLGMTQVILGILAIIAFVGFLAVMLVLEGM